MDRPVVFPALRASPRFRRFWTARLLSHTAQSALLLGLLVTVVTRTGSTIHSSLLVLTFVVPAALLGLIGGVVTDRLPSRELLLTTALLRTALCLLFLHGDGGVAAIYATNLGLSVLTQFASPAESAALPRVVQEGQVVAATAALNLESILAQVLGTMLIAPLLVRALGLIPLFVLAALAFFGAAVLYAGIPELDRVAGRSVVEEGDAAGRLGIAGLRAAATHCWRLVRGDPAVLRSVIVQTLVATTVVVLVSLAPVYTRSVLGLPAEASVAVFAPAAIGVFLSLRLVPRLALRCSKERLATAGFVLFVLGLLSLGFVREWSLLLTQHLVTSVPAAHAVQRLFSRAALAATTSGPMGFAYGVVLVTARAILYERVPAAMQGRVFAFQGVLGSLASILPLLLVGLVAYWLGPRVVLLLVAAANLAAAWGADHLLTAGPPGPPPEAGRNSQPCLPNQQPDSAPAGV